MKEENNIEMETIRGVYKITNKINNKVYIGESMDIHRRWKEHVEDLNNNTHHSYKLQNDWKKYGQDNFKFEIIRNINDEDCYYNISISELALYVYEDYYINQYNSINIGYNVEETLKEMLLGNKPILGYRINKKHISMLEKVIKNINDNNGIYINPKLKIKKERRHERALKRKEERALKKTNKKCIKNKNTKANDNNDDIIKYILKLSQNVKFNEDEYKVIGTTFQQIKINSASVFKYLRNQNIFDENNIVNKKYIQNNYFKMIEKEYRGNTYQQVLMSEKGFLFILNLIQNNFNDIVSESIKKKLRILISK